MKVPFESPSLSLIIVPKLWMQILVFMIILEHKVFLMWTTV